MVTYSHGGSVMTGDWVMAIDCKFHVNVSVPSSSIVSRYRTKPFLFIVPNADKQTQFDFQKMQMNYFLFGISNGVNSGVINDVNAHQ